MVLRNAAANASASASEGGVTRKFDKAPTGTGLLVPTEIAPVLVPTGCSVGPSPGVSSAPVLVLGVIFWLSLGRQHVLEGFSFAMIIGVLVGTYSSIFVASPVVAMIARKYKEATA